MSAEIDESYRQMNLPGEFPKQNFKNSGIFVENDWTEFAEKNHLLILISSVRRRDGGHRAKFGGELHFLEKRYIFVKQNPWDEYLNAQEESLFKLTIMEYKNLHTQSRPYWAMSYFERVTANVEPVPVKERISRTLEFEERKSYPDGFMVVEKEIVDPQHELMVLRFTDGYGACRRVITFQPGVEPATIKIRQEDWMSKGRWVVSLSSEVNKSEAEKLIII